MSQTTAEVLIGTLASTGIDHVFVNAGTDTAPIIEALAVLAESGSPTPIFSAIPHETIAVAMAHGYFRAAGKPAAVLVHTTPGSANALMGVMNAQRDQVPMLVMAGRTPNTESGALGSRSLHIHWGQDSYDQGAALREYTKWDYELRAGQPVATVLERALAIAGSSPPGPVYLSLPREVLAAPATPRGHPGRELTETAPAVPDGATIDELAHLLAAAERPLVLTSSGGRSPRAFELLTDLATDFALPVGQPFATDVNLPSSHPCNFGSDFGPLLSAADLVLVIEAGVPWTEALGQPSPDAKVVQISNDPQYAAYPLRGFRTDLALAGDIPQTLALLREAMASRPVSSVNDRRARLEALQRARRARSDAVLESVRSATPIHPTWIAACINEVKTDDAIVLSELGVPLDILRLEHPGTLMREPTSGGLGFALGAALGIKLAAPDRQVIATVGDGSYMFGSPTAAHFVARSLALPTLTVILNNRRWNAVHTATRAMYPAGRAMSSRETPLAMLTPSPHFERTVLASDGYGERVERPEDLVDALGRGLAANVEGRPTVLNVLTSS